MRTVFNQTPWTRKVVVHLEGTGIGDVFMEDVMRQAFEDAKHPTTAPRGITTKLDASVKWSVRSTEYWHGIHIELVRPFFKAKSNLQHTWWKINKYWRKK